MAACIGYASSITLPQNTGRRVGLRRRPTPKQKQSTCALKQMADAKAREDLQSLLGVYLHHVRQTQGAPCQAEMTHPHAWFSLLTSVELSVPKHPWGPRGHQKGAGTPDAADETNQSKLRCVRSLAKPISVARWGLASRRRYTHQKTGEHPTATFSKAAWNCAGARGRWAERALWCPPLTAATQLCISGTSYTNKDSPDRERLDRPPVDVVHPGSKICRERVVFVSQAPHLAREQATCVKQRSNVTRAKLAAFGWRPGTAVGVKLARRRHHNQHVEKGKGRRSRRFQASRPARSDATRASPKNKGETTTQKNSRTP